MTAHEEPRDCARQPLEQEPLGDAQQLELAGSSTAFPQHEYPQQAHEMAQQSSPARLLHLHMHVLAPASHALALAGGGMPPAAAGAGSDAAWHAAATAAAAAAVAMPAPPQYSLQDAASTPLQRVQKRRGPGRLRRVVRALLLAGGGTLAVLAGVGGAVIVLSPRVEALEARCGEALDRNARLEQQAVALTAARSALEARLLELAESKAALQQQLDQLSDAHGGLAAHGKELAARLQDLTDAQGVLQAEADAARGAAAEAAAAATAAAAAAAAAAEQQEQQQQQQQQALHSSLGAQPRPPALSSGDLHVQLSVPGFTDALVSRVSDAQLLPQLAGALVDRAKEADLVGDAADALLGRLGAQLGGALRPWKWPVLSWARGGGSGAGSSGGGGSSGGVTGGSSGGSGGGG